MELVLNEDNWKQGLIQLRESDPQLVTLFDRFPEERIQSSGDPFQVLANAIVGQQISVAAAAAIFGRLEKLLGSWDPAAVERATEAELRQAGLSVRKVEYFRVLARAFATGEVDPTSWPTRTDAQILTSLTSLRGIGRWTAEMFLIFQLRRPDVLPLDDLGLLKSAAREFGWSYPFETALLTARAQLWRPWRTIVVWHLWRAIDREPVVY
jgi:DNA-3-methyladenine glycosylase II